ncbi:MAG TPA: YqgE/AlgH family protein [Candidatus Saccharimonadia bacterium]|nr:YqgE/AlgH family protein [Candidatus Saccharimonadia bacterium]
MEKGRYLTNHFLIAMPSLLDPNFSRGVTFVCQHSKDGAMGIIINRAAPLTLGDVLAQMDITTGIEAVASAPVYLGGPVQPERGFVLHDTGESWDSSFDISETLAVTTSRDILAAMAEGKGPKRALIALGYAGWSEGQLEQEVRDNAWLTVAAAPQLIFDTPLDERWNAAAALVGIDMSLMSDQAGHA